jgi:hypothetical protein
MSAIVKMEKVFSCLKNFRDNCNNEECKKLIDIFLPMFYQENKHYLEISVGKKASESKFCSVLSMITTNFNIKLSTWNNEPQFIISDFVHNNTIATINLKLIENLCIESEEDDNINFYRYSIYFNYNNEIDYNINIAIKR